MSDAKSNAKESARRLLVLSSEAIQEAKLHDERTDGADIINNHMGGYYRGKADAFHEIAIATMKEADFRETEIERFCSFVPPSTVLDSMLPRNPAERETA